MILLRITLFFLILLLLPDWYIYKFYIKHSTKKMETPDMVDAQYRIATGSPCLYIFPSFTTTCFQPVPHHSTLYRRTQDGIYGVRYNSLPLQKKQHNAYSEPLPLSHWFACTR